MEVALIVALGGEVEESADVGVDTNGTREIGENV